MVSRYRTSLVRRVSNKFFPIEFLISINLNGLQVFFIKTFIHQYRQCSLHFYRYNDRQWKYKKADYLIYEIKETKTALTSSTFVTFSCKMFQSDGIIQRPWHRVTMSCTLNALAARLYTYIYAHARSLLPMYIVDTAHVTIHRILAIFIDFPGWERRSPHERRGVGERSHLRLC